MPTREEALRLHSLYERENLSLKEVGARVDRSDEWVRQLFDRHDLPRRTQGARRMRQSELAREEMARRVSSHRRRIIDLYKEHGNVETVVAAVKLPRPLVAAVIDEIPNRESYKRKGARATYSREELIAALHRAHAHLGVPLTSTGYRDVSSELGLPSMMVQVHTFGSWHRATVAAGIASQTRRTGGPRPYTPEVCAQAVARCIAEHDGERVSYETYRRWAPHNDAPSGATVRNVLDSWNAALAKAFELAP